MGKGDPKNAKKRRSAAEMKTSPVSPPARRADGEAAHRVRDDPLAVVGAARCRRAGILNPTRHQRNEAAKANYTHPHWIAAQYHGWGTELAQAGDAFAKQRAKYLAMIGAPHETASAPAWGDVRGGGADPEEEDVLRATDAYMRSLGALEAAGPLPREEVLRVCCRLEREPGPKVHPLKAGLTALLAHYRLGGDL